MHRNYFSPNSPAYRWRKRAAVLLIVAAASIFAGGVAIAQSSQLFDLACRGTFTAAGGTAATVSMATGLTGALGVSTVGATSSNSFGVRSGFLSAYPNSRALATQDQPSSITPALNDDDPPVILRLPVIVAFTRIVRGGC